MRVNISTILFSYGSDINKMPSHIRAVREQNEIKILACLTDKFHCAYSPYALSELNLAITQKILAQHEKKIKILSFYPR